MLTHLQSDLLLDVYEGRNRSKTDRQILVDAALAHGVSMERVMSALGEPPTEVLDVPQTA